MYLQVSSGRIEVFDIQSEIAFAYVRENRIETEFPSGSVLEAVPAGSISHLIRSDQLIATELANESELENTVAKLVKGGNRPYSCVFALANFSELVAENGPAYVNQARASLFARLKRTVRPNVIIGQIAPDQQASISPHDEDLDDLTIVNLLVAVHDEFGGKVRFNAGVLSGADAQALEISPNYGLKLAQYAIAAIQRSDGPAVIHFSSGTSR